jgi:hypothetical protein
MTGVSRQWAVVRKDTGEKPIGRSIIFWLLGTVLLTTVSLAQVQPESSQSNQSLHSTKRLAKADRVIR